MTRRSVAGDRAETAGSVLLLIAIILVAVNLRPVMTAFGPLISEIRADTGISAAAIGLLGALPVFCFGVFSGLAPRLARRFGLEEMLCVALLVLAAGALVRVVPGVAVFFLGTVLIGLAIAVGNVLLPAQVKRSFPGSVKRLSNMYVVVLNLGASLGAAVAVPLASSGLGWRWSLAIWAAPALLAALVWMRLVHLRPVDRPEPPPRIGARALLGSRLAVVVTLFMGLQATGFYIVLTWLPEILVDFGQEQSVAALIFAGAALIGAAPIVLLSVYADRIRDDRPVVVACCLATATGIVTLLLAGHSLAGAVLGAGLIGIGQGTAFALALSFFASRAADEVVAAEMSGTGQSVGYLIAAPSPLIAGVIHELTGGWEAVLIVLIAVLAIQVAVGLAAGRPGTISRSELG